jgi:predicted MFS family arabinose efflux permease
MAFNFRQLGTAYPLHFDRTGMPLDWLGLVQALNGLMIVLLEIALLSMTRHWPVRFALGLGYIIFGVCFLLFFGGASLTIFIAVMVIFTIGEMLAFSRQQAYSASLSHDDMRGRYSGFLGLAWCIGSSSGAAVGMWVYEWNPQWLWLICAAFGILAAICLAFSKPKNGVVKEPA